MSASFSVVIPNLDGADWLRGCLGSLAASRLAPAEVIVADDGSGDDSAAVCAGAGARFLPGPRRTGFAATVNRGIRVAGGRWVLLLNNDTEVHPDALGNLADAAARHPGREVLAPLVRSLRDRVSIDSAGLLLFPDGTARPRWHGLAEPPVPLEETPVLMASFAAAAVRRDWFDEVGLLDESFGSYCEDVDWSLRAARAGARGLLVPDALVWHHFSGTVGAFSAEKARLVERNRVIVAARHLPLPTLLASPAWTARRWLALRRASAGALVQAPGADPPAALARAALRGLGAGLLALPAALGERRRLAARDVMQRSAWRALLRAHRASLADMATFGAG